MNRAKPGRLLCGLVGLLLVAGCVSGVSTRQQRILYTDRQLSRVNRELIGRLFRHYRELREVDLAEIERRAQSQCSIDAADEADSLYDGQRILYTGDYREGVSKGETCVWNQDRQLLKFGQFDGQGKVNDLAVELLKGRPYIIEKNLPERQLRVKRSFFLFDTKQKSYRILVRLELDYEGGQRRVRYVFDHLSSALLRRYEDYRISEDQWERRGIQFILSTNRLEPICIEHKAGAKEQTIPHAKCVLPIQGDLIAGANRI